MRDLVQRTRDRLEILQNLWAAAIVTAALTIGLNVLLAAAGWALPGWLDPAQGFVVFAIVSGVGFLIARQEHRQRLETTVAAVRTLLDDELAVRLPAEMPGHVTLRTLAAAAAAGDLATEIAPALNNLSPLGWRLKDRVDDFERATAHDAGLLSPPRANLLVRNVIRRTPALVEAADKYNGKVFELLISELRYDLVKRHAAIAPEAAALTTELIAFVADGEELERLGDAARWRREHVALEQWVASRTTMRQRLQSLAAGAAVSLLTSAAPSPEDLASSSIGDAAATLREIAAADPVTFAGDEEAATVRWIGRARAAGATASQTVAGQGWQMHPWTHDLWVAITAIDLLSLERVLQAQQGALHARALGRDNDSKAMRETIEENLTQARKDVRDAVKKLVEQIDRLTGLQIRR